MRYSNYSDDGAYILNGTESVTGAFPNSLASKLDWNSNLVQTGYAQAPRKPAPADST